MKKYFSQVLVNSHIVWYTLTYSLTHTHTHGPKIISSIPKLSRWVRDYIWKALYGPTPSDGQFQMEKNVSKQHNYQIYINWLHTLFTLITGIMKLKTTVHFREVPYLLLIILIEIILLAHTHKHTHTHMHTKLKAVTNGE